MKWCSILHDFETDRQEETLVQLEKYMDNSNVGMDASKYIQMCEMLGDEVDFKKIPIEYEDFPTYVHHGITIFNALPDNYLAGMTTMYIGKDLAVLPVLYDLYDIDRCDQLLIFEVVQHLDAKARKQAIRDAKKANK